MRQPAVKSRMAERLQPKADGEIDPLRVVAGDQSVFPAAMPVFQLLFAHDCPFHVTEKLEAYQHVDIEFGRMSFDQVRAVLIQSLDQMRRYADVNHPERLVRENIDAGLLHKFQAIRTSRYAELVSAYGWPRTRQRRSLGPTYTLKRVQGDGLGWLARWPRLAVADRTNAAPYTRHAELVSAYGWPRTRQRRSLALTYTLKQVQGDAGKGMLGSSGASGLRFLFQGRGR